MVDFTTGAVQASWACDTGYFPGAKSAAESPAYKEMLASTDYSNANVVAYRESAQINEEEYMVEAKGWTKFVDPGFVGSSTIRSTVKNILANVFNHVGEGKEGAKTYEEVLNDAYTTLKDYVHNNNTSMTFCAASFPMVVVLPTPVGPTITTTRGGLECLGRAISMDSPIQSTTCRSTL